jgi:predicted nucleic acid-binding Zn ribbon protein
VRPTDSCPNCGADLPPGALACPECGSCEETGWSEEAESQIPGLPDDKFDYEEFVKREFEPERAKPRGLTWFWWVMGIIVVVVFLMLVLR